MHRNGHFPTQRNQAWPIWIFILSAYIAILAIDAVGFNQLYATEPTKLENQGEKKIMNTITGEFEVKIVPADSGDPQMGMMLLDKKYLGDLEATGKGRMLTGMTSVKDSAGYVAIERIEGKLKGKRGTFLIQHSGTMSKGKPTLLVNVIPDSGTDELVGLEGTMDIRIVDRKHFYDFRYILPEKESTTK